MIAQKLSSVIICKARPKTKSMGITMMNKFIRNNSILAIGDGGNDVDMLREARIGVGIFGNEGRQAVNASDYAISRFKFLQPLLFVHGRQN